MKEILAFLNNFYRLSPACISYLSGVAQPRMVAKGEVILDFGDVNKELFFIRKCLLRCYYMVNDKEVSGWFFWENATVVSIGSFYSQKPSQDRIVAEEAGELYYITKEQFDYATETFHEFCLIALRLTQKYLETFNEHACILRKYDAAGRFKLVRDKYPAMVLRIRNNELASWLNMEPETLSRIRGRRD